MNSSIKSSPNRMLPSPGASVLMEKSLHQPDTMMMMMTTDDDAAGGKNGTPQKEGKTTEVASMKRPCHTSTTTHWPSAPLRKKSKSLNASTSKTTTSSSSSSLIANLKPSARLPLHDFPGSLGLEGGQILFPTTKDTKQWSPQHGALDFVLDNVDVNGSSSASRKTTLAIKFKVPSNSKRFSLNIGLASAEEHSKSLESDVLLHLNPRQFQGGGQLVINNKAGGSWGQAMKLPLSRLPVIFGQEESKTLLIQINKDGFDVYIDMEHCARFEHRMELPSGGRTRLILQFPLTDDYGSPENWTLYRVWWGFRRSLSTFDNQAKNKKDRAIAVPGVGAHHAVHPRKLFIRNLPNIHTISEVEHRRAQLERAFRKYGGRLGVVKVTVPNHKSFAFVEVESGAQADLALREMSNIYTLCRARQSKFEQLQDAAANRNS